MEYILTIPIYNVEPIYNVDAKSNTAT